MSSHVQRDLEQLHPMLRVRVSSLLTQLQNRNLRFRVFEGFRTPQRQAYLFSKGRNGNPEKIVTRAKPWQSLHQYGCAVDIVLYENGKWSWDDTVPRRTWWTQFHEMARQEGLEPLSWEKPHIQLSGLSIKKLKKGKYPSGGDRPSLSLGSNQNALLGYRIIARNGLRLRSGPGANFDVLKVLQSNTLLNVTQTTDGWCQVDLQGDGSVDGYCYSGFLEKV